MNSLLHRLFHSLAALAVELFRAFVLVAAFGLMAAAVLAWLGYLWIWLDVVAHFALPALWLSIAVLGLAAVSGEGWRRRAAIAAAAVLAWGLMLAPEVLSAWGQRKLDPAAGDLTLVQFNVWGANTDPDATEAWLRQVDADIVVVEESSGSGSIAVRALSDLYPHVAGCRERQPCSTLILSKTPSEASGAEPVPHTAANLAWARFSSAGGPFAVVGVHHSWPEPLGHQDIQIPWTAERLRPFDPETLILAGDFNASPWTAIMSRQDRAFGLERRTRGVTTFPAQFYDRRPFRTPFAFLAIDHVYAGAAWRTVSVERGPALGSDHYPVVVRLRRELAPK